MRPASVGRPITPEVAKQKRGGDAGMLLRDEIEAQLAKFNSWMSADAIRQVIEKLEAIPPTIDGNREMLAWLRGERQWYDEAEKRHRHVQLIDFEAPAEERLSRHLGMEAEAARPQRQPGGRDVRH